MKCPKCGGDMVLSWPLGFYWVCWYGCGHVKNNIAYTRYRWMK